MTDRFFRITLAVLLALQLGATACAQELGGGSEISIPVVRLVLGLVLSILLALVAALVLLRRQRGRLNGVSLFKPLLNMTPGEEAAIQVIETRRVSAHGDVCLVRSQGQDFLILVTANQLLLLNQTISDTSEAPTDEHFD